MSLLILQTHSPEHKLVSESYGVIATAAMLGQTITLAYCGEGVKQLADPETLSHLQTALDFGLERVFANADDCGRFNISLGKVLGGNVVLPITSLVSLIQDNNKALSF